MNNRTDRKQTRFKAYCLLKRVWHGGSALRRASDVHFIVFDRLINRHVIHIILCGSSANGYYIQKHPQSGSNMMPWGSTLTLNASDDRCQLMVITQKQFINLTLVGSTFRLEMVQSFKVVMYAIRPNKLPIDYQDRP